MVFFIGLVLVSIFSSCSQPLMSLHESKRQDEVSWSDAAATSFVNSNRTLASMSRIQQQYKFNAWDRLRPEFEYALSTELYKKVSKQEQPSEHLLYASGNTPWREKVERISSIEGSHTYEVNIQEQNSKEAFGEPFKVYFTIRNEGGSMKVVSILHPK